MRAAIVAGVLAAALALTACGKDEPGAGTAAPAETTAPAPEPADAMAAFRECMAEQGVELPDPAAGGGPAPTTMPRTQVLQAAMAACRDQLPEGMVPAPAPGASTPDGDVLVG